MRRGGLRRRRRFAAFVIAAAAAGAAALLVPALGRADVAGGAASAGEGQAKAGRPAPQSSSVAGLPSAPQLAQTAVAKPFFISPQLAAEVKRAEQALHFRSAVYDVNFWGLISRTPGFHVKYTFTFR